LYPSSIEKGPIGAVLCPIAVNEEVLAIVMSYDKMVGRDYRKFIWAQFGLEVLPSKLKRPKYWKTDPFRELQFCSL